MFFKLFKNLSLTPPKSGESQSNKNSSDQTTLVGGRRYFEVFGDALNENAFLKNLIVLLAGMVIFLIVVVAKVLNRPPLIIRVDELQKPTVISEWEGQTAVTSPEIRNFTRIFLKGFLSWDIYTYDDNFKSVFTMMTPLAQKKLNSYLEEKGVVEQINKERLKTTLTISEIAVVEDTQSVVVIKAKGTRVLRSYDKPEMQQEIIFEDTLTLRKVSRTNNTPWGLLLDDWSESLFKGA